MPQKTKIYIIGSGAVGKALAVMLADQGRHVILVRGRAKEGQSVFQEIVVQVDQQRFVQNIELTTFEQLQEIEGVVLVTTKAFGNVQVAQKLKTRSGDSPVVILQNGLGIEKPFVTVDLPELYRCVLFMTSQTNANGEVSFRPVAPSPVGPVHQSQTKINEIIQLISVQNFPFAESNNINEIVWKKTIINCAFNTICPLLAIDNGIFHRDKKTYEMAKRVIDECVAVAAEYDVQLNADEIAERLLFISKSSDGQLISTLQDLNHRRETEVESLNLEVGRMAQQKGLSHLARETKLLGELLKKKSELLMLEVD